MNNNFQEQVNRENILNKSRRDFKGVRQIPSNTIKTSKIKKIINFILKPLR